MNVRSFEWRDLPTLHRYRAQCLYLDHARVLTRGPIIAPTGAVLSSLSSASGIFTYLAAEQAGDQSFLIGQVMHDTGQGSASLTFLAPESLLSVPLLAAIIETMAVQIGERGGMRILAEVDSEHPSTRACARLVLEFMLASGFGCFKPPPPVRHYRACGVLRKGQIPLPFAFSMPTWCLGWYNRLRLHL